MFLSVSCRCIFTQHLEFFVIVKHGSSCLSFPTVTRRVLYSEQGRCGVPLSTATTFFERLSFVSDFSDSSSTNSLSSYCGILKRFHSAFSPIFFTKLACMSFSWSLNLLGRMYGRTLATYRELFSFWGL